MATNNCDSIDHVLINGTDRSRKLLRCTGVAAGIFREQMSERIDELTKKRLREFENHQKPGNATF